MDTNSLQAKFEDLKNMLVQRASASLGEAALKLFLTLLDAYQDELTRALSGSQKASADARDENTLLLGLIGVNDTGVIAKLASQSGEIRFLRQEVLDLRKYAGDVETKHETLALELERVKGELAASFKAREKDQDVFNKRLEDLGTGIRGYGEQLKIKELEYAGKKSDYDGKIQSLSKEIEAQSEEAIKRIIGRLNNSCREIDEASGVFRQEMEKLQAGLQTRKSRGLALFADKDQFKGILEPLTPGFKLLNEKVEEAVSVLKKCLEAYARPEVKAARVNWNKLFDDLKTRYGAQASGKKIRISWPSGKMPADFVSDQGLLLAAFGIVLQNSIEALPAEGTIGLSVQFSGTGAQVVIADSGKEINPEQRGMLFTPLFTTKSSHYGFGLVNCRRFLKALGGDAVYAPAKGGNSFQLTFAAIENPKIKK